VVINTVKEYITPWRGRREADSSMFLCNNGKYLQDHTASQPSRSRPTPTYQIIQAIYFI
jgi:hypothetical protein